MEASQVEHTSGTRHDIVYRYRLQPRRGFEYVSPSALDIIGYSPEEHYANPALGLELVHPDDRHYLEEVMHGEVPESPLLVRWVHKDGRTIWVEQHNAPVRDDQGEVVAITGRARVVGSVVAARHEIQDTVEFRAELLNHVSDAVIATDRELCIRTWNSAAEAMYGWSADEVVGRSVLAVLKTEFQVMQALGSLAKVHEQGHWQGRVSQRRKDGSRIHVYSSVSSIRDRHGVRIGLVAVNRDITEITRLESELLHAHKLEAIGQLTSGVAHDFNNLLMVISGTADILLDRLADDSPLRKYALDLKRAVASGKAVTRQLLDVSRKDESLHGAALDEVIATMTPMLGSLVRGDVEIVLALGAAHAGVSLDRGRIEQILMNLTANARDAMATGGRLGIKTFEVSFAAHDPRPGVLDPGRYVVLEVSDTGCGMDQETMKRVFEPFFTTKDPGKGTGLGMATLHALVQRAGGHVEVDSEVGAGTLIRLYLPWCEPETVVDDDGAADQFRGHDTVLVVEDDPMVRAIVRHHLEQAGYTVLCAPSARDALTMCASYPERIDVVLTDVLMPGMRGPELATELARQRPDLRVLYMSTASTMGGDAGSAERGEAIFLSKPFGAATLLRTVRQALGTPATLATPAWPEAATAGCVPATAHGDAHQGHTILLVEDDQAARWMLQELLQAKGYDVVAAASGSEALSRYSSGPAPDLMVTDLSLPDQYGGELASALRRQAPYMPVLYMSGYSRGDQAVSALLEQPATAFVQKPIAIEQLIEQIEKLLAPDSQ